MVNEAEVRALIARHTSEGAPDFVVNNAFAVIMAALAEIAALSTQGVEETPKATAKEVTIAVVHKTASGFLTHSDYWQTMAAEDAVSRAGIHLPVSSVPQR